MDIDADHVKTVFMSEIMKFREELAIIPVPSDCVPLTVAAELCAIGTTGNMVTHLMTLQAEGDKMAEENIFDKYFWHLVILGAIALFMVLGYMIIKNTGGN